MRHYLRHQQICSPEIFEVYTPQEEYHRVYESMGEEFDRLYDYFGMENHVMKKLKQRQW